MRMQGIVTLWLHRFVGLPEIENGGEFDLDGIELGRFMRLEVGWDGRAPS